ncbi:hypothetical protein J437_LFUL013776 [Ladona fulva]|uniref:CCHC-type domain-containing protein n=1 Tax=Ladona fulva TaxID=123851 RepID=A0A8K0KFZ4_LADFU|nr:hypothetical protein J437_LFUL013776 [Ladona fulva]
MAKEGTDLEDPNKIKDIVKETINPGQEAIKINTVKTAGKKRIIIETKTQEDKEKIVKGDLKQKLEEKGLKVENLRKKDPKIILFSIDRNTKDEELKDNLYNQNLKDSGITKEKFMDGFKYSFTKGRRDSKYCNRVFQVTPEIRETLINKDKIYAGWESHYIKDFTGLTWCYRCQGYGHTAERCRDKEDTCSHCAKKGHRYQDCPNKDRRQQYANCQRFVKDADHSTMDMDCPAYRYALERDILQTGYTKN